MLSAILAIAAIAAAAAGIIALLSQFIPTIIEWISWANNLVSGLFEFVPFWLLPFAAVGLILAFVGLGVKLL